MDSRISGGNSLSIVEASGGEVLREVNGVKIIGETYLVAKYRIPGSDLHRDDTICADLGKDSSSAKRQDNHQIRYHIRFVSDLPVIRKY
jgi:hypothetical protein